jgi:hypothetical protein
MSNIRKSDVKNHLSLRFRKKIFLSRPDIPPGGTTSPVGEESKANDSTESALNLSSPGGRKPVARINLKIEDSCLASAFLRSRAREREVARHAWSLFAERRSR